MTGSWSVGGGSWGFLSGPRSKAAPEILLGTSQERELGSGIILGQFEEDFLSGEGIRSL